ncbi:drug/metabolite transporter [Deferribacter desulfuricans SSM1]|uniref:Drug/metabolite transporter n=1 Tax=Deferribacter desulfuricans (strain DSM 14783 / JCM 11476 / NBRC 101012 / SSM1) TaxID=639282 RepID=D3P978_DEFDS|nr:DMT family transporter [Deferribacter desulfuricans]BAI81268.1 drug/metabolite transporter [Deferribacter desulfuricans SSM1]
MREKLREYIADISLIFISLIWGSTFVIIKEAIEDVNVFSFLTIRFGLATIIMLFFVFKRVDKLRDSFVPGLFLGLTLFAVFAFQTIGLKYTLASIAGFLTGLYVIFVPILSVIFLKQVPRITSIIGVIFALSGLYMISFYGEVAEFNIGIVFLILNAFFIAIHIILIDIYSKKYDVVILTFIQFLVIFVLSFLFSLLFKENLFDITFNGELIFAFILTGVFATVVAFFIQILMQKYTTPTKAALIFTFEPVSAAFFGYLIGAEILAFKQYIGSFLILLSIIISEVGPFLLRKYFNRGIND